MLDNAPFLSHKHGNLTIEGYSRAAVQSYWRVPELKLGFDLGAQPWDFMGNSNLADYAWALRPRSSLAGVYRTSPHDEDGPADHLYS